MKIWAHPFCLFQRLLLTTFLDQSGSEQLTECLPNDHLTLSTSSSVIDRLPNHLFKLPQSTVRFQTLWLVSKFRRRSLLVARSVPIICWSLMTQYFIFNLLSSVAKHLTRGYLKLISLRLYSKPNVFGCWMHDRRSAKGWDSIFLGINLHASVVEGLTKHRPKSLWL